MLRNRIQGAISWILFVYFALVIVPPVSSFAAFPHSNAAASTGVKLEPHQSAALLIFDIMLWQQLKKTKQSEDFLTAGSAGPALQTLEKPGVLVALFALLLPDFLLLYIRYVVPLSERLRSSLIRFSRSGISPPVFSS